MPAVGHLDPKSAPRRWPDVLRELPAGGFEAPPRENRCLWLTVRVPSATQPGTYRGRVVVSEVGGQQAAVPVEVLVHDLLLPAPSQWDFRVDFWQSFRRLAAQYQVAEWSEPWWALVKIYLQDLAEHGESVVQVGRAYFDWQVDGSGQWRFAFERFDRSRRRR